MKFDGKAFGEEVVAVTRAFVAKELAPLLARLEAAEKRVAELEAQPDVPAIVEAAVEKALSNRDFAVSQTMVTYERALDRRMREADEAVAKAIASLPSVPTAQEVAALIPVPNDGLDGAPGEKGLDGAPGIDGKDGLSVAGILKDHEGWLVFTLADGTMQKIAHVDGKDGKDGAPGRDVDMEFVRTVVQDEVQKQVNAPMATAYKGVWKPENYKNGDIVTCGGSLWLAKADTTGKPENTDDWTLIVKRGRDGKDGELKAPAEPKPVKLK